MAVCGIKRNFKDFSPSPLDYSCSISPIIPHKNSSTAIKNPRELAKENAQSAPKNGVLEWSHSLINKLMASKSVDDAIAQTGVLKDFERTVSTRVGADLSKKIVSLKKQAERLTEENTILKCAVVIQHERCTEYENKDGELQHLKDLAVPQLREKLTALEVNNYALAMHLKQALQNSRPFPGDFHSHAF